MSIHSGKALSVGTQQCVLTLIDYFEEERSNGGPIDNINNVRQRVANALKISVRSVNSIKSRGITVPKTTRNRSSPKTHISSEKQMELRNIINMLHAQGKNVSLTTLNNYLKSNDILSVSKGSLQKILKSMGYFWQNHNLMEESSESTEMGKTFELVDEVADDVEVEEIKLVTEVEEIEEELLPCKMEDSADKCVSMLETILQR